MNSLRVLVLLFALSLITLGCSNNDNQKLSSEYIRFISIYNQNGYSKTIEDIQQIHKIIEIINASKDLHEQPKWTTPNKTIDSDYFITIYYDPSIESIKSYDLWLDYDSSGRIAPISKNSNFYELEENDIEIIMKIIKESE